MKYTFFATYHVFDNEVYTLRLAQNLVLEEWRAYLDHQKIPFIPEAKVSFKTWDFSKYPYQELLKNWVFNNFKNHRGDLCYRGKKYWDVEDLIAMLNLKEMLMELTVEVEE